MFYLPSVGFDFDCLWFVFEFWLFRFGICGLVFRVLIFWFPDLGGFDIG